MDLNLCKLNKKTWNCIVQKFMFIISFLMSSSKGDRLCKVNGQRLPHTKPIIFPVKGNLISLVSTRKTWCFLSMIFIFSKKITFYLHYGLINYCFSIPHK